MKKFWGKIVLWLALSGGLALLMVLPGCTLTKDITPVPPPMIITLGTLDYHPTPTPDPGHDYYQPGRRPFEFGVLNEAGQEAAPCNGFEPCRVTAVFEGSAPHTRIMRGSEFHFREVGTDKMLNLLVIEEYAGGLALQDGATYELLLELIMGWPNRCNLIIWQDGVFMYQGMSDTGMGDALKSSADGPVQVQQTRILNDHYQSGKPCFKRIENTEIAFTLDGQTLTLHQGQTGQLGDYQVALDFARRANSQSTCPDAVATNLSYTIVRQK